MTVFVFSLIIYSDDNNNGDGRRHSVTKIIYLKFIYYISVTNTIKINIKFNIIITIKEITYI